MQELVRTMQFDHRARLAVVSGGGGSGPDLPQRQSAWRAANADETEVVVDAGTGKRVVAMKSTANQDPKSKRAARVTPAAE